MVQLCIQKLHGSRFEFKCKGSAYNLTFIMDGGVALAGVYLEDQMKRMYFFNFDSEGKVYNKSLLNLKNLSNQEKIKELFPLPEGNASLKVANTGESYGGSGRIYLDTIIIYK